MPRNLQSVCQSTSIVRQPHVSISFVCQLVSNASQFRCLSVSFELCLRQPHYACEATRSLVRPSLRATKVLWNNLVYFPRFYNRGFSIEFNHFSANKWSRWLDDLFRRHSSMRTYWKFCNIRTSLPFLGTPMIKPSPANPIDTNFVKFHFIGDNIIQHIKLVCVRTQNALLLLISLLL